MAVSAGTLRAIGSAMAGVIVVFKGRRFVLLFSCFGAILAIEIATGAMLIKQHIPSNSGVIASFRVAVARLIKTGEFWQGSHHHILRTFAKFKLDSNNKVTMPITFK